jgi:hypothetical protein
VTSTKSLVCEADVSLNLKKSELFRRKVDYLGHVLHPGRLAVAEEKCSAVAAWALPKTKTEMRSFVDFCNVYRRLVPGFARIASP